MYSIFTVYRKKTTHVRRHRAAFLTTELFTFLEADRQTYSACHNITPGRQPFVTVLSFILLLAARGLEFLLVAYTLIIDMTRALNH